MKKIIISLAIIIVLAAVLLTACKKKEEEYNEGSTVSQTHSETTSVPEYSTEENGDVYITNAAGEHIPVTTSKDGTIEMYDYLVTKTAKQVEEEKASQKNESGKNSGSNSNTTKKTETTTIKRGHIEIGSDAPDSEEHAAIVEW